MRNIDELNEEELSELRESLYYELMDDGSMEEIVGKNISKAEDIPMKYVKDHYVDTYFVTEDFWCNAKD